MPTVQPKLRRIVNSPAVPPSNILLSGSSASSITLQTSKCQLARIDPSSCLRDPSSSSEPAPKMQFVTVHPNQPLIAYVLEQKQQLSTNFGQGGAPSSSSSSLSSNINSSQTNVGNTKDIGGASGGAGGANSDGKDGGGNGGKEGGGVGGGGGGLTTGSGGGASDNGSVGTSTTASTSTGASVTTNSTSTIAGGSGGIGGGGGTGPSIITKMIQVQHLQTRNVLWSLSLGDLANLLFGDKVYSTLSKDAHKKYLYAIKILGKIRSIRFFDPSTIYFSGMQMMMDNHNNDNNNNNNNNTTSKKTKTTSNHPRKSRQLLYNERWQTLIIQFTNRLVMLNLRKGPCNSIMAVIPKLKSHHPSPLIKDFTSYSIVLCHLHGENEDGSGSLDNKTTTSSSSSSSSSRKEKKSSTSSSATSTTTGCGILNGSSPSSNALPITDSLLLFGCYDGTFKCYDWKKRELLTSIKGLGKNDYVTQLIASNTKPSELESFTTMSDNDNIGGSSSSSSSTSRSSSESNNIQKAKDKKLPIINKRRLIVLTKKAISYLIEMTMIRDKSSNNTVKVDIRPPLVRFEGGAPFLDDDSFASSSSNNMEHEEIIKFDKERQLFLWCAPIFKNNRIPRVLCWDLSRMEAQIQLQLQHQDQLASGSTDSVTSFKQNILRPEPTLTIQYPFMSQIGIFPGWSHPSYPETAMISAVVTSSGELHIMGANLNTTGIIGATPINSTKLEALLQRDTGLATDGIIGSRGSKKSSSSNSTIKSHYIGCPNLWDSNTLLVASNIGLMMIDYDTPILVPGPRHYHLGAGLGTLGKSALFIKHSTIGYGSIDTFKPNPIGIQVPRNPIDVYESPSAVHLPPEIRKRPFRMPPSFIPSPSGMYICLFWNEEMRYEVLHTPTLLKPAGEARNANADNSTASNNKACVASGTGVSSFAWVTEHDIYCTLHSPPLTHELCHKTTSDIAAPTPPPMSTIIEAVGGGGGIDITDITKDLDRVKDVTITGGKLVATGTAKVLKTTGKVAATVGIGTAKTTAKVVTTSAGVLTKIATFGLVDIKANRKNKKEKQQGGGSDTINESTHSRSTDFEDAYDGGGSAALTTDDNNMPYVDTLGAGGTSTPMPPIDTTPQTIDPNKKPWVEFRALEPNVIDPNETSSKSLPAISLGLDELQLRGGNRIPPVVLFGGPVLCVASRSEEDENGYAHFYTPQKRNDLDMFVKSGPPTGSSDNNSANTDDDKSAQSATMKKINFDHYKASEWVSSGPTMPFPDIVVWDDDGRLCAVVIHNRVAIYLSEEPDFVLLGTVRAGVPADPDGNVTSAKFIHGVLYCCTRNSIQCVFLGDILSGGICHLDTHILASTDVPTFPDQSIIISYSSLTPPTLPINLKKPFVLGYQNGSLIISTSRGLFALPLMHPLLRIGSLLAAGQIHRAVKWFNAVPDSDHEELASFLERRGVPEKAIDLPGLSLETTVDICMRYGYINRLEELVESYGVKGLRTIDMGRSVSSNIFGPEEYGHSVVVCIGAYLLSYGRTELVRRLVSECLRLALPSSTAIKAAAHQGAGSLIDEGSRKDAFVLAALLLNVTDEKSSASNNNNAFATSTVNTDALRLIGRAVAPNQENNGNYYYAPSSNNNGNNWIIGDYVRDHLLSSFPNGTTNNGGGTNF